MELEYYIDAHLHFHDPAMTDPKIKELILAEFPALKNFYSNPDDNSPLLGLLDALKCRKAWIINYESPDVMGYTLETNEWVSKFCENSNGRLIPIGSVHPGKHNNAATLIKDYVGSGMLKAIKLHGPHQLLKPNAYLNGMTTQKKMYDALVDLQVPVIFHTGTSIFPKARSRYGHPLFLEDVLIDFPDLVAIMAHGGRPFWMREAEFLMAKFENLYMDLSGIPPHLLPQYYPRFHKYADRCIFGSDYPSPGVKSARQNAEVIANLPLDDGVLRKILFENAEKLIK